MTFDWQTGLALSAVTIAAVYLTRRTWQAAFARRRGGCGTCSTCPTTDDKAPSLVTIAMPRGDDRH